MAVKPAKQKKLTKTTSGFGISIFDSIDFVNPAHWNSVLNAENLFLSIPYLQAMESTPPLNMRYRYAIMYQEKKPAAIAYFQIVHLTGGSVIPVDPEHKETNRLKDNLKKFLIKQSENVSTMVLICGNAFVSGENGFHYSKDVDPDAAFKALADAMYRIRKGEKLNGEITTVMLKDFYDHTTAYSDIFKKFKYRHFKVEPAMALDMERSWTSFDAYMSSLASRYRSRVKAIRKKGSALVIKDLGWEEIKEQAQRIEELYNFVHLKAGFRLATFIQDYFWAMKKKLPANFGLTAYYLDGRMVGFRTTFKDKHFAEAHFIGLDYAVNREYELYQNILYDYVNEAIELQVKQLHLGRTASEIKSTLGAKAHDLTCYVRRSNPVENKIMKPFIGLIKPSEWEPRNPFKAGATKD